MFIGPRPSPGRGPMRTPSEAHPGHAHRAAAGVHGAEPERVRPGRVVRATLDVEGPARGPRGGVVPGGHPAVVPQHPAPDLTVAVAVDLRLDLDAAVVGLGLDL